MNQRMRMAVAIPAYRRSDLLQALLETLPADRVSRVYVSIDGARAGAEGEVAATLATARAFASSAAFEVLIHALPENVGAATNVLGSVAWMLRYEERGVVLEDDCHPIPEFFDFIGAALDLHAGDAHVWLACGTQVAPPALIGGTHVLSTYPLIWGWGTTRAKWSAARHALDAVLPATGSARWLRGLFASPSERYWHGGMRRSAEGRVDAWDLPLVYAMRRGGGLAVLPRTPLVSNVGDDERATHTAHEARWTRLQPMPVGLPLSTASASDGAEVERWLERNLYGISARHLVSTGVRWLLDRRTPAIRPPLARRLTWLERLWRDAPAPSGSSS